jgi:hypothetical protein
MRAVLLAALVIVTPGALFIAQSEGLRWVCEGRVPRPLRRVARGVTRLGQALRRRPHAEPLPPVLLGLELRRLAAEVRRIEVDRQPHRAARLAAALAAYDRVLLELCEHAQVQAPRGLPPLSSHARLDLEADLVASGVDW